ncbi:hypothetical protein [Pseudophaeobacter arcticus]|jgi:hypothetical protein|nr:hypothetical protein [Pseudophaeobacter arcticus]
MKLHYQSGACPMASHIALHETGHRFEIEAIDMRPHPWPSSALQWG